MTDIKLIPAICPRCGANLDLPEDLQKAYCTYCGTEIMIERGRAQERVRCKICDGFGRLSICRACDGKGRCGWETHSAGGRERDILMITYSSYCLDGMCSACKGTGRYMLGGCPGCEGTGRCPRCLGTGKCLACHGAGLIPDMNGAEKCLTCDGTGFVDPDAPELPSLGRCPDCKRIWRGNESNCWYCGYRRNSCPNCGASWIQGRLWCEKCGFGANPDQKNQRHT